MSKLKKIKMPKRASLKEKTRIFINNAMVVHGGLYDYSEVKYINSEIKISIKCKDHGFFDQLPFGHLNGKGCLDCGREKTGKTNRLSDKQHIADYKKVHTGMNYTYIRINREIGKPPTVTYKCPIHGEHTQSSASHKKGIGCPTCGNEKRAISRRISDKQHFIECDNTHKGKNYKYISITRQKDIKDAMITYECPIHNKSYTQQLNNHKNGQGCPDCGNIQKGKSKRISDKENINICKEVHAGKNYNYISINRENFNNPTITYECPIHKTITQSISKHKSGQGCPTCTYERNGVRMRISDKQHFIDCNEVHFDKNYKYIRINRTKGKLSTITFKCPIHNKQYTQTLGDHKSGQGCPDCGGSKLSNTKDFIKKAKKIHGNLYGYDNVNYIYAREEVKIKCKKHNIIFKQTPNSHLGGSGCPICNKKLRIQQKKIFDALKKEFPFLIFLWEERYSFMNGLEFDISVLVNEKLVAIEYDGEHHFEPVRYGGRSQKIAEEEYEKQINNDKKKNRLANINDVELIRVPFYMWMDKKNPDSQCDILHEIYGTIEDYL